MIVWFLISGIVGLGLAYAGIRWFDSETQNIGKPYWMTFDMDAGLLAFINHLTDTSDTILLGRKMTDSERAAMGRDVGTP